MLCAAPDSRSYCSCHAICAKPWPGSPPSRFPAGHAHVVERDLRGVRRAHAELVELARTPRRRARSVSTTNSETPRCCEPGLGLDRHRHELRPGAVGDEHLPAVDDPGVAVALGAGGDRRDVGAGVGLGQRDRADLLAADRRREVALLQLVGPELGERRRAHVGLHRDRHRDRAGAAPGQLLDEEEARGEVAVGAAPGGGVVEAEEAELAAPAEHRVGEEAGRLPLVDVRADLRVHVAAHARPAAPRARR